LRKSIQVRSRCVGSESPPERTPAACRQRSWTP
jgi:hypothetical protein